MGAGMIHARMARRTQCENGRIDRDYITPPPSVAALTLLSLRARLPRLKKAHLSKGRVAKLPV
jgi:hypothetical protein